MTTSSNLGPAPVADYELPYSGVSGQAWTLGRDDGLDFALLTVGNGPEAFDFFELGTQANSAKGPDVSFALLSFPGDVSVIDKTQTLIGGERTDFNTGLKYLQLQAVPEDGAEGAALVDNTGTLQGIRINSAQFVKLGFPQAGEVWAISAESLSNIVLPRLQTGEIVVNKAEDDGAGGPTAIPGFPHTFRGTITIGGEPARIGSVLYARVRRAGRIDVWSSRELTVEGRYMIPASVSGTGYNGADVDFFLLTKESDQRGRFKPGNSDSLSLTFQQ